MIKIEIENVNLILNFHYQNLTNKKGKERLITDRLDKRIKQYSANPQIKKMYEFLKDSIVKDKNGFSILIAKPYELDSFKDNFEKKFGRLLTKARRKDLLNVFYYDNYYNWKAYELAKKINVNVCPYCNRMYTLVFGDDFKKGTRFEYDHFFLKAEFPYLALSFYNLIPSCHICNSNFKGEKKFSLIKNIHPYVEGFSDDIVFSIKPRDINFINGKHSAYRIKFKKGDFSKWDNIKVKAAFDNITTFQLTKLFNMHKDYVDEIIQKSIVYNQDYIKSLYETYNGTLFKNEEDVKKFILGNYINENDYSKRVLSKLTSDISKELGF